MIKKGCFFLLFLLILVIGIGYYIFQKYEKQIISSIENKTEELLQEQIPVEIHRIVKNKWADSLEIIFEEKMENLKKNGTIFSKDKLESIKLEYQKLKDLQISDSLAFIKIKNMFENEK
jgi:hypothetical protein